VSFNHLFLLLSISFISDLRLANFLGSTQPDLQFNQQSAITGKIAESID